VWIKIVIVVVFIGIIVSLASALFAFVNDKGDSRRTVRALTFRVGLSVGLFVFLMILVGLGVIQPHGLYPERPTTEPSAEVGQ
jgi:NADH:ubiquinone oxidoreductase subunit 6 (subunit J)